MGSHRVGHDWCDLAAAAWKFQVIDQNFIGFMDCLYSLQVAK